MSRIAYVNGRFVPHRQAAVHVEDRGYQFADGVYEVIAVVDGELVDVAAHFDRLDRSLKALQIAWPMSRAALLAVLGQLIRKNRITAFGSVYLQVTRGVAPRGHAFPLGVAPALVMTARTLRPFATDALPAGVRVITVPDERWARPDIKSVSLLPNVLAKQKAAEAGAYEAWLVDREGRITEGSASNAWIVTATGELITHQADLAILNGITRIAVLDLAAASALRLVQRPFSVDEAKRADEAFLTSTTSWVKPVVQIDDVVICGGRIGPLTARLVERYARHARSEGQ